MRAASLSRSSSSGDLRRRSSCKRLQGATSPRAAWPLRGARSSWSAQALSTRGSTAGWRPTRKAMPSAPLRYSGSRLASSSRGWATLAPNWATAPSQPQRRPAQTSAEGSFGSTNSTKGVSGRWGRNKATASGSSKPVRYQKSLAWRKGYSTSAWWLTKLAAGITAAAPPSFARKRSRRWAYSSGAITMGSCPTGGDSATMAQPNPNEAGFPMGPASNPAPASWAASATRGPRT